jgi:hypothetical protein
MVIARTINTNMKRLSATLIATSLAAFACLDASAQTYGRNSRGGVGGPPTAPIVIGSPGAPTAPGTPAWPGIPSPPSGGSAPCVTSSPTPTPTPVSVWGSGLPSTPPAGYAPPTGYSAPSYPTTAPLQSTIGAHVTSSRARSMLTPIMPLNPRTSSPNLALTPWTGWSPPPVTAAPSPASTPCSTPPIVVAGPSTGFGPNPRPIPEPNTLALVALGLAAIVFSRRRSRAA